MAYIMSAFIDECSAASPYVSTNVRHLLRLCSMILKLEAQAPGPAWLRMRRSIFTRFTFIVAELWQIYHTHSTVLDTAPLRGRT